MRPDALPPMGAEEEAVSAKSLQPTAVLGVGKQAWPGILCTLPPMNSPEGDAALWKWSAAKMAELRALPTRKTHLLKDQARHIGIEVPQG